MTAIYACLDAETTGTDPAADRIVSLAVVRVAFDGTRSTRSWRCNPGVPIGATATAVHGITDADVADCPAFADVAAEVLDALTGCVLVTFNGRAFDLPLLRAEFARCGVEWTPGPDVDVLRLDRARTRHDLPAVVRRWCGREHTGAHDAEADAAATLDVLRAMLAAQPGTVAELVAESDGNAATPCGKVVWSADGRAVWAFGKHKGQPIGADPAYARWVLGGTFSDEVKALAARGARGEDVRRAT